MNVEHDVRRASVSLFGLACVLAIGACASVGERPTYNRIAFNQNVHFSAPDGSDVVAAPGAYDVEAVGASALDLAPTAKTPRLRVQAVAANYDLEVSSPVALALPGEEDAHHVVLLLPDGSGLDAVGFLSGVRGRGPTPGPLPIAQVQAFAVQELKQVMRPTRPLRGPSDFDLAYHHAPIHYQDTDSTNYRADYITRFDYDGNMNATDNWENLTKYPLAAYAYYSVVETCTHWFIAYGFFHPRDWTDSSNDQEHENDMEGLLSIVRRDGTAYGRLEGMVTVYHDDFFSFTPAGSPLQNGHENIDGALTMQNYDGSWRPLTVQQAKGHGLKAWPFTSDFRGAANQDGIIYYPSKTQALVPRSGNDRHVDYGLIDFFAPGGLWHQQLAEADLSRDAAQTFARWGAMKGDRGGGCGNGITVTCSVDSPHPPWGWDDHNDGPVYQGEMALDPAHLVTQYFSGLGQFGTRYLRNRYITDLQARGYRLGRVPRGWAKEITLVGGVEQVLPDNVDRINIGELFTKLTATCP